ncbi:ATP-dependent RNA helicase DDX42 [Zancudomyces culisetae]|uniref:ATP-dependent RNA helicase DDX42 n=1 Tax=Zancudomyces culisetae TaxID=1213189 RepID=A0A1R1PXY8_ZANCU|nr:ATP-dependent RNA helicase DDX42 [Zancudomyces culisetae]|eukprot:OMH85809.1 ATP-dependent RNA helicase DDX42 [Zancudomyces culisetae]
MNSDILQSFVIFESSEDKWSWLSKNIVKFIMGKFLHGDMLQTERDSTVHAFKTLKVPILVATDVASRGLDIKSVKTVINYEVARDVESHIHRVGRTGRAGEKGEAYTLFSVSEPGDVRFASKLTKHLNSVGLRHLVTSDLLQLAQKDPRFEDERSFSRYSMGHPKILAPLLEKSRLPTDKSGLGGKQMGASPTIFDKPRATLISNPVSTSTSTPTFSSSFIGFTKASSQAGGASGLSSIDLPNEKLSCNTPVKKKSRWG